MRHWSSWPQRLFTSSGLDRFRFWSCLRSWTLHLSKSQDYGSESDPLANIRQGAEFVGIEPWRGCMVRVADKVQRLRTFCRNGRLVHEGVRDTLLDLAAYSLLAVVLFDEGRDA